MTEHSQDARLDCPNGDGRLHAVRAGSRTGSQVLLDQCDSCGGIWFDKFELFQIGREEAVKLDTLDEAALRRPQGAQVRPECPRCHKSLTAFHDPNIPENIQMLFCAACDGFWLNHGALSGYTGFREALKPAPDPQQAEQYEKMLAATSEKDKWNSVSAFSRQLAGPRDLLTGLPLDGSAAQLDRMDQAHDFAYAVVRTIFRLLFGV